MFPNNTCRAADDDSNITFKKYSSVIDDNFRIPFLRRFSVTETMICALYYTRVHDNMIHFFVFITYRFSRAVSRTAIYSPRSSYSLFYDKKKIKKKISPFPGWERRAGNTVNGNNRFARLYKSRISYRISKT